MSQSQVTLFPPQALTLSGHLQPLSSVCTSCQNTKKPQFIVLLFYKASFHNLSSRYLGNMPFSTQVLAQQLQLAWEGMLSSSPDQAGGQTFLVRSPWLWKHSLQVGCWNPMFADFRAQCKSYLYQQSSSLAMFGPPPLFVLYLLYF